MSQEITVTRYLFSELSDEAKEKAIENEMTSLSALDYSHEITECLEDKLARELSGEAEIPNSLEISWDLSYSQGSGVSFEGRLEKAEAPFLTWPEGAAWAEFSRIDRHYSHAYTVRPYFYDEESEELSDEGGLKLFRDQYHQVCRALELFGYELLEGMSNREAALDNLSNGYLCEEYAFRADGTYDIPKE